MDMLPTLCTAMKRAGGDCLVLRTGEAPHVLIGERPQNVARAILSPNALEALVSQIFSDTARRTLADTGEVDEPVTVGDAGLTLVARATRRGDQVTIELREKQPERVVEAEPVVNAAEPAQWLEVAVTSDGDGAFDAVPSFASTPAEPVNATEMPIHDITATPLDDAEDTSGTAYEDLFLQVPPAANTVDSASGAPAATARTERHEPDSGGTTWSFAAAPASPETFAVHLPPIEESAVHASHKLEFVEPPSPGEAPTPDVHVGGLVGWAARATARGATALYLRGGAAPMVRVDDRLQPLSEPIEAWRFDELVTEFAGGRANGWEPGAHGEWTQRVAGVGQVSCWSFTDDQGAGLMMRLRPQTPSPSLYKLIPRRVRAACDGDGLIVVAAATTADVAAMAATVGDLAGRRRGGYVIALRAAGSPRHEIAGAFVSQREFSGGDGDVAAAIRSAANESPDVLIVAPPTSEAAMREVVNAADGGRLVIVAVLAPTAMQALRAISGRASSSGDAQTRLALATSFRAAFAYRVLQRLGGGRTFVRDLVVGTSEVSAMLASGDFAGIAKLQRDNAANMTTVDDALARSVRRGHLSLRQAAAHAVDKKYLVGLVRTARRDKMVDAGAAAPADVFEPVGSSRRGDEKRWSSY